MENKELLIQLEIPLYIREYIKSKSIRAKYYERGGKKKIPLKYTTIQYEWRSFKITRKGKKVTTEYLFDRETEERVIANPQNVGKENRNNINGQDIYNGNVARHDRNNMMGQIKDSFRKYLKDMQPITRFPIRIDIYLFDTIIDDEYSNGQDWDVDNRFFPYGKTFADMLKKEGKIPDDNRLYITEPPHAIFVPVPDPEDRKFIIRIYKDNRMVILNNYLYQQQHGNSLK